MKTPNSLLMVWLVLCSLSLVACTGMPVHTGVNNKHIDTANVDFSKGRRVSGTASGFQLLLFIPININNRHVRAYELLLAQASGDYISDIKVDESWTYGLVGTVYSTSIEAMAYPVKQTK